MPNKDVAKVVASRNILAFSGYIFIVTSFNHLVTPLLHLATAFLVASLYLRCIRCRRESSSSSIYRDAYV